MSITALSTLVSTSSTTLRVTVGDFDKYFKEHLHHFTVRKYFSRKPDGYETFKHYCEDPTKKSIGLNNEITIKRAIQFINNINSGMSVSAALDDAWQKFMCVNTGRSK